MGPSNLFLKCPSRLELAYTVWHGTTRSTVWCFGCFLTRDQSQVLSSRSGNAFAKAIEGQSLGCRDRVTQCARKRWMDIDSSHRASTYIMLRAATRTAIRSA